MAGMYRQPFSAIAHPWMAAAGSPPVWLQPAQVIPRGYAQAVQDSGMPVPGRPEFMSLSGTMMQRAASGMPRTGPGMRGLGKVVRLGAEPAAPPGGGMDSGAYATASLLGAAAGGTIVGYIATADVEGAMTAGLFTTGLAGLSDAFLFAREDSGATLPLFALGLGALGWALFRFSRQLQAGGCSGGGGSGYRGG